MSYFNYRFSEEEIPVDILKAIVNKSRRYSLIILVTGHSQSGKTSFVWHTANRIMQIKKYGRLNPNDPRNTWKEWDAYNLTATNAKEFVKIWNNNDNSVLTLAECSETLYYMDWMSTMARVFNSTTTTQGLKKNICFLDTVMSTDIMKHAKEKIDFRIWTYRRLDWLKKEIVRSGFILIDFLRDRWKLIPYNTWEVEYSEKEMPLMKAYTNWIAETLKSNTAILNEERVGLIPNAKERELLREAQETREFNEKYQKEPIKIKYY